MPLRFLVDSNAGRLAKWLRAMGYDALFVPDGFDRQLIQLARMDGRILLTKDTSIFHRRAVTSGAVKALLVKGDSLWEQLRQVSLELDLKPIGEFSRCIRCNQPLAPADPEEVQQRVPPFVLSHNLDFFECPVCRRIYWRGTHWSNMMRELEQMKEMEHA